MKSKINIIIIGLIVLTVLSGCGEKNITNNAEPLAVTRYARQDLSEYINSTGSVESKVVSEFVVNSDKEIKEIYVSIGDMVHKGDKLYSLDIADVKEEIKKLEVEIKKNDEVYTKKNQMNEKEIESIKIKGNEELNSIDNILRKEKENLEELNMQYTAAEHGYNNKFILNNIDDMSSREMLENGGKSESSILNLDEEEKKIELYEKKITSENKIIELENEYKEKKLSTDQNIEKLQNNMALEKIEKEILESENKKKLKELNDKLNDSIVKSDIDGIVTKSTLDRQIGVGERYIVISSMSSIQIKAQVSESNIFDIVQGMDTIIVPSSNEEKQITGRIMKVYKFPMETGVESNDFGKTKYDITVETDDTSDLLLGMSVKLKIKLTNIDGVLAVPYESILMDEKTNENYVMVAEKANDDLWIAHKRIVLKGTVGDYYTEVKGDNLKEGDIIIISPQNIIDGEVINIDTSCLT